MHPPEEESKDGAQHKEACRGRWGPWPCGQGRFPLNGQEATENLGCAAGGVGRGA